MMHKRGKPKNNVLKSIKGPFEPLTQRQMIARRITSWTQHGTSDVRKTINEVVDFTHVEGFYATGKT